MMKRGGELGMGITGSCQSPKLEIRNTKNYGLGVFACEEIRGGG
jgi:hypothetical protein